MVTYGWVGLRKVKERGSKLTWSLVLCYGWLENKLVDLENGKAQ